MADAQGAAGDRVHGGDVGRAVVGQHALDRDAVAGVEGDRATQKPDGRCGPLVVEDLGVGQARGIVDGDVHELPARPAAAGARGVGERAGVVLFAAGDALAGAALDASELLDIDVHQLAGAVAFVALGRLQS